MGTKGSYKLFFAIPFDCDTRCIYKYVVKEIQEEYKVRKLVCIIGNEQIGAATGYETIETFKMQNSELFRHFVKQIRDADIVVADLTDNNPNVHVELGIALFYNKNILRVTRHSYEKLGFDVRNYQVSQYKMREDLFGTIVEYLNLFLKIKDLDFHKQNSKIYYHSPEKKLLSCWNSEEEKKMSQQRLVYDMVDFQMRDGKVHVTFKITDQKGDDGWFGVYSRVGSMGPLYGSCLVYVRKNGMVEIATYPGQNVVKRAQLDKKSLLNDRTITVELEGDLTRASIENINLEYSPLDVQSRGSVWFACWNSNAEFWNTQIVCRDTIGTFDIFE